MVVIYNLALLRKGSSKSVILCNASNLSDFRFFQKKSAKEFMRFSSTILVDRTEPAVKVSVEQQGYVCHAFVRTDGLAAVAVTDDEYPTTMAHVCLKELLDMFSSSVQSDVWTTSDGNIDFPRIKTMLTTFSNPMQAPGSITRLKGELDETKIILHKTLDDFLLRGEKLDDLINAADELSVQSKAFYRRARKSNSCCSVIPM